MSDTGLEGIDVAKVSKYFTFTLPIDKVNAMVKQAIQHAREVGRGKN